MSGDRATGRSGHAMADLVLVLVAAVLTDLAIHTPVIADSPIRAALGLVFVLFLPGYALVAALFPEAGRAPAPSTDEGAPSRGDEAGDRDSRGTTGMRLTSRGIDGIERVALSFALSIAVVPLLALGVEVSPAEFAFDTMLLVLNLFVFAFVVLGAVRRIHLPAERRFVVPYRRWWSGARERYVGAESRTDAMLNVGLAAAIVLAVTTLGAAALMPPDGERYTEFYVLGEDETGEPVAAGYPDSLVPGEPSTVHLGIENSEREEIEYDVVVQLQRLEGSGNDTSVAHRTDVDRFSVTVSHNETWSGEHEVVASDELTGPDLRLVFLLYHDGVPDAPTRENAYRDLFVWVDVGESTE